MKFLKKIFRKIFKTENDKKVKALFKTVNKIEGFAENMASLSDSDLKNKTFEFKERISKGETLEDILPEAFAVVREAGKRVLNMYHYPVQLLGGIALHKGMMAEMKTGEGKTLVATLPAYLNALEGKGVHVVTVNDYLAKRDSDEMGQIFKFLGLSTSCILEGMQDFERKHAYSCDITYATNNQLGFDYLRDNMKMEESQLSMRGLNYAIIDEADSVCIDNARTPLIISGQSDQSVASCEWIDGIVRHLGPKHYEKDEKMKTVTLNDAGIEKIESIMRFEGVIGADETLYEHEHIEIVHSINQALKAHTLFTKDVDYMIKEGQVVLIDEFTGRVLDGRRYSDGLHQAIEAKEKVEIQSENKTLASITFQKFFTLYNKISGMSGTCMTEDEEFEEIYKVKVIEVPTHKTMKRVDHEDEIYRTFQEKLEAILAEIAQAHEKGQPVLVVTGSIEMSEIFSTAFRNAGFEHRVLNARHHKEEAFIIAEAGALGSISIATNMAGRGTDIQLGGSVKEKVKVLREQGLSEPEIAEKRKDIEKAVAKNKEKVLAAGGLYVLGTERNESRRVDNQARGRAGRQGDIGKSKFFLSLEDNLMRIFGSSDKLDKWLVRLGLKDGEPIIHPFVSRAIEKAQQAVEARNFDWRKNIFKYDQVLDEQRKMIYQYRMKFLKNQEIKDYLHMFVKAELEQLKEVCFSESGEWMLSTLHEECIRLFALNIRFPEWQEEGLSQAQAGERLEKMIEEKFNENLSEESLETMRKVFLKTLDDLWQDHLSRLDHLRQSVSLKSYAQKDPLVEYKKEGFVMFEELLENFRENSISFYFHM